ncbi:MAG: ribonucleotide-diphosphate reductase subunit beta [Solirubrobacterales bacterium]|nr:ribonucleotide-diphosphate reductase subunit beta [Solirubrobacterales bacterium]
MISEPRHFAALAARLRWDADGIDLSADRRAWGTLEQGRRRRLTVLLAGFCVAEYQVAEELTPFEPAARDPATAAVFAAQRADERRHARLFDRVAMVILGAPGADARSRRQFVRALAPAPLLDLFEHELARAASALAVDPSCLADSISLYHLILEGVVLTAGELALLSELEDGSLPHLRQAIELVERDERWHVGFGLRCMLDLRPAPATVRRLLRAGELALQAWGAVIAPGIRSRVLAQHRRRLVAVGLLPAMRGHDVGGRAA